MAKKQTLIAVQYVNVDSWKRFLKLAMLVWCSQVWKFETLSNSPVFMTGNAYVQVAILNEVCS
jgi:hypothetical protein